MDPTDEALATEVDKDPVSRGSRRSMTIVAALSVVAILMLASMSLRDGPEDGDKWKPSTSEECLYDHYYNESNMGYYDDIW